MSLYGETHSLSLEESIEYIFVKGKRFEELDKKLRTKKVEKLKHFKWWGCSYNKNL